MTRTGRRPLHGAAAGNAAQEMAVGVVGTQWSPLVQCNRSAPARNAASYRQCAMGGIGVMRVALTVLSRQCE